MIWKTWAWFFQYEKEKQKAKEEKLFRPNFKGCDDGKNKTLAYYAE